MKQTMPKQIYIAYLNTFTFSCIQMVLYTTIPYITEKTGVTTANIIMAISVGSLIFSFMGPFWAAKSDKIGRKRVLSFGMFGMMLSFALLSSLFLFNDALPLMVKIGFVFLSRIIYGLLCSAIVPVSQAWQLDFYEKSEHLKVLTRNSICLNLGRILGPILILLKQVNFEIVIYTSTVWVLFLASSVFLTSQANSQVEVDNQPNLKAVLADWKINFKEAFLPIMLAMVFTSFVGVLYSFLGHHLKTVLEINGKEATLMFAKIILGLSFVAIIFQQLSNMLFKTNWRSRLIIGALSIVLGTYLMMWSSSEKMIWISILFVAIASALIPPVYLALTSNSTKSTKNVFGKKLGLASVAHSFGYAVGAGLIALSMKMHLVSSSLVVFFISISILGISLVLIFKKEKEFVFSK